MEKISVIEDKRRRREEIIDMLSFEDYEVIQADNGRIGLEVVRQSCPDLVRPHDAGVGRLRKPRGPARRPGDGHRPRSLPHRPRRAPLGRR